MLRPYLTFRLLAASAALVWGSPLRAGEFDVRYGQTYAMRDSGPLLADVYLPRGDGPFPGVLVVHGGAWRMGTRAQLSPVAQLLAQHGMAAVAISYRLAPQDKFPAQIEDCKEAIRWMRSHAEQFHVDAKRIGAFGYSAGAHLAALLGTTDAADGLEGIVPLDMQISTRIQAVAAGGAPCDFRSLPLDLRWLSYWLGGTRRDAEEQYRLASPAAFVTPDDPPMFFFHGETDDLVPLVMPQQMCDALHKVGVPAELYVVPNIGHMFAVMDRTAITKSVMFLATTLHAEPAP